MVHTTIALKNKIEYIAYILRLKNSFFIFVIDRSLVFREYLAMISGTTLYL